jgi:integrase
MSKGQVTVELFRGRLRLRWRWQKKRQTLTIGADTEMGWAVANQIARSIEADMLTGNYDETRKKYRVDAEPELEVVPMVQGFLKTIDRPSPKHRALLNHVKREWSDRDVESIGVKEARLFLENLKSSAATFSAYLFILRSIWEWKKIEPNPWDAIVAPKISRLAPDPFTQEEVELILKAFEGSYYLNYLKILLATGCRPGEVSALQWGDVKAGMLTISRSWSDRELRVKETKTGKVRQIPITTGLAALFAEMRGDRQSSDLIVPGKQGGHINPRDFLVRHWRPILKRSGIRYRPTYRTRHTVWSHAIAEGMPVAEAAEYAGNRSETMIRHYVGRVSRSKLPDFLNSNQESDRSID